MNEHPEGYGRLPLPPDLSPRRPARSRGPRTSHRGRSRLLSGLSGTLSMLVLVVSALSFSYYHKLNSNVHRVPVQVAGNRPAALKGNAENILLVGSDSRNGATPAQLAAAHTTSDGGGVSTDTIILMHIAANGGPVTLVSFPRDSWVSIPGHRDAKINSAFADGEAQRKDGGLALLTQTVEQLSGERIDHEMLVNFFHFIDITNAIGGINVCVNGTAQYDSNTGANFTKKGNYTIKGSSALAFVRQRHGFPGDTEDFGRINRQQRFFAALAHKAKSIRNPLTINSLLDKATSSLTVDKGLSFIALVKLAERLQGIGTGSIKFATVPVSNGNSFHNGQSAVDLNMSKLPTFFANLNAGRDPNGPAVAATPSIKAPAASPADVHVTVLNGSGLTGKAASTRSDLAQYGYQVDGIGDASRTSSTQIRYPANLAAEAASLAKAVPGAALAEDGSLSGVQLILGNDFAGVHNPSAAPAKAPSTAPSPSAPSGQSTAANTTCGP